MPLFEIEQYEIHIIKYRVEADRESEALAKLFQGAAEPVDGSTEFVEVCEDCGLPVDENRELADELQALGIPVKEAVIPSIRSITAVE